MCSVETGADTRTGGRCNPFVLGRLRRIVRKEAATHVSDSPDLWLDGGVSRGLHPVRRLQGQWEACGEQQWLMPGRIPPLKSASWESTLWQEPVRHGPQR